MSLQTIYFQIKSKDTSKLPPFYYTTLTYLPATETEQSVKSFIVHGIDGKAYKWTLKENEWVGGIEEEGYSVSDEISLEIINVFKDFNFV